ncbi:hypothetical protein EJ06DRAFT_468945 [Trichodelitschia bisporula]|uniref:YTH domain-containing protein n=1 Tax=Trichodelitschia bisporula TaxID=703511 RepID=A0A6G1IAE8_9PEZI|nr:hypothetical protein EJ06DRAFT_468945 [Trichodelitschia bisporula]
MFRSAETIVSSSTSSLASLVPVPRGPPRKPKQSGHALWVGNLPPNAGIIALKDHFSLDAKDDIESVFLISKSNCAFVNYRTAEACHAAQIRFHESKFAGSKLVCRLRKRQEPKEWPQGPRARYGPGDWPTSRRSSSGMSAEPDERVPVLAGVGERGWDGVVGSTAGKDTFSSPGPPAGRTRDRYFVVKSLTQLDLEQSVRNGIWTTQSHNEAALNKAFESSEDVYLIFSVNKSGEYFGYARMASSISDDSEIHQEILSATTLADHPLPDIVGDPPPPQLKAPSAPAASMPTLDPPKMIPTPATDTAPPGRVIDDSARGTIFWEAGSVDGENTAATESDGVDGISPSKADYSTLESSPQPLPQIYGKPFRVQWLSTTRVPYWRMRGLRNPWNSNREVKIARDGTELETTCGRKLLEFFKSPENIDGVVLAAQR